jgi:tetratricopeptide (TPR) repeat protein
VAEEILNDLVQITSLHVTSRSSSFTFRDQTRDIRSIASQLGVEHILEGSVRKSGNTVRITAQLIETVSDRHIWSQTYDRDLSSIFAVQDEISKAIVESLKLALTEGVRSEIGQSEEVSIEAYDLYLQGLHAHNRGTVESLSLAKDYFEKVIEIEPKYASAWYWLSRSLLSLPWPAHSNAEETEAAALKAIELNPKIGGAHTVLSLVSDWDPVEIPALREKALSLAPSDAFVVLHYGRALEWNFQAEQADIYFQKAVDLDPMNLATQSTYARFNMFRGRVEKAERIAKRILKTNPGYAPAWRALSQISAQYSGDFVTGISSLMKALELDPDRARLKGQIAGYYLVLEDVDSAKYWLDQYIEIEPDTDTAKKLAFNWLYISGHEPEASQILNEQFELSPVPSWALYMQAKDLIAKKNFEEAISLIMDNSIRMRAFITSSVSRNREELRAQNINEDLAVLLEYAYRMTGNDQNSNALIERLEFSGLQGSLQYNLEPTNEAYIAEAQKLMRDGYPELALSALEKAVAMGFRGNFLGVGWQIDIRDNPVFAEIHEHPQFLRLLDVIDSDMAQQRVELASMLEFN